MKNINFIPMLNLQLFAEGAGAGDGGTAEGQGVTAAAALPQNPGVEGNSLADVKYGIQEEPAAPAAEVQTEPAAQVDRKAEFEKLIKGEYKDEYDARVQDTVQKRLKGSKDIVDKYNALTPTLEMMAKKYGVDPGDIEALTKAIEEDNSFYEEEALERGITVQQLKEIKKMERENAALKAQMAEAERQENGKKLYAQWMQQADETKQVYPTFDLQAEMQNQTFLDLLRSNIDVRTAYEVTHKDEIIAGAMQFTAKTVESKIVNKIASGGARPQENGMAKQSAAVVKSDVSQLTNQDIDEVMRRVARGERVSFG